MEEVRYVTIFESFVRVADTLNDAEQGRLYRAITHYALDGEEPKLDTKLNAFFTLMKPVLDKSIARKAAGKKGGKSKANSEANEVANHQANVQANSEANEVAKTYMDSYIGEEEGKGEGKEKNILKKENSEIAKKSEFPKTVKEVLDLARSPQIGVPMSEKMAEDYLMARLSTDWIDGAGRAIRNVGFDIKRWYLRSEQQQRSAFNAPTVPQPYNPDEVSDCDEETFLAMCENFGI